MWSKSTSENFTLSPVIWHVFPFRISATNTCLYLFIIVVSDMMSYRLEKIKHISNPPHLSDIMNSINLHCRLFQCETTDNCYLCWSNLLAASEGVSSSHWLLQYMYPIIQLQLVFSLLPAILHLCKISCFKLYKILVRKPWETTWKIYVWLKE